MYSNQQSIYGLILAAGISSRMGDFKPLMPLLGKTIIENTVGSVLDGGARAAVVVTGYRSTEVETVLRRRYENQVIFIRNPDFAETDMLHSIQIGCTFLPPCDAFFLLPGDMPAVRRTTFQKLLDARHADSPKLIFPTLRGYRKHPPLVDASLIPDIIAFRGNGGLRQLWGQYENLITTVPVDDEGVWVDLDTQKDYRLCKQTYESEK